MSCTKIRVVPAVTPVPDRASQAPNRNTPSCAVAPATEPNIWTRIRILCFPHCAAASDLMCSEKMASIRASA